MKRLFLLAIAFPLPASAAIQETPPAPVCQAVDAALPANLAAWTRPAALTGALRPGTAVQVALQPIANVQATIAPHAARDGGATTGARVELEIATAGIYQVALSDSAWVDLIQGSEALRPVAHGRGPACSSIHRSLDFTLSPGRYVIQLSGTTAAASRLLVIPR